MDAKDGKLEMFNTLVNSGEIYRPKKSKLWIDAFTAYELATNDKVSFSCRKCFDKVVKWLRS